MASLSSPDGVASVDVPGLTPEQLADFERDGFLVIPGFAPPDQVHALLARGKHLLRTFDPSTVASVFSTKDQSAAVSAKYFADSASKVSFFFEEGAVAVENEERGERNEEGADAPSRTFELAVPKEDAVNKIGHALHDADETFRAFSRRDPRLLSLLRSLGYESPVPVQSMYICKPPRLGGEVVPHQDACFLRTTPKRSVVGCWLALERAGVDNGCLWAVPGSHKGGAAGSGKGEGKGDAEGDGKERSGRFLGHGRVFGRRRDGSVGWSSGANERDDGEQLEQPSSPCPSSSSPYDAAPELSTEGAVPLEADPGTLVLLDGAVVHFSRANDGCLASASAAVGERREENSSSGDCSGRPCPSKDNATKKPASRHAYALHVVEGGKGISWHERNWLQRPEGAPFEPLY